MTNLLGLLSHDEPNPDKTQIDLLRGTSVCEPLSTKATKNKGAAIIIRKHSAPQNTKTLSIDNSQSRLIEKPSSKVRRAETPKEKFSARLRVSRKESLLLLPDNAIHHPGTSIKQKMTHLRILQVARITRLLTIKRSTKALIHHVQVNSH